MRFTTAAAPRQSSVGIAFAILALAFVLACKSVGVAAANSPAVRLTAAFARGARLGQATALDVDLRIDLLRAPSPVVEMQLLYPRRIGITTSGLGVDSCRLSPSDIAGVVLEEDFGLAGCPRNAILGRGVARAEVRLGDPGEVGEAIPESGRVTILSGGIAGGRLQLVTLVLGVNPFGALLAYGGEARPAPRPFGDSLWIGVPQIPSVFGASVALARLTVNLGDVVYYERPGDPSTAYRPDGIQLPTRCPPGNFRFAVRLRLTDGQRLHTATTVRCPPRS